MITNLTDELLADYSDDDIAAYIRDYFAGEELPDEAINYYVAAMRMKPSVRAGVFRLFNSAPLLCSECGAPSCIHGYSDE